MHVYRQTIGRISTHALICLTALVLFTHTAYADAARPDLPTLVETLMPTVVNISTYRHETPNMPMAATTAAAVGHRRMNLGSGFVIDASGIIATNKHVVEGAEEIYVTLHDGTMLSAKLLSVAAHSDIAMLKVNATGPLPVVTFADSDKVRQGDAVIAIGNPLGWGGTVTTGIVSALDRDIRSGPYDSYIQTDASINRGNSGGPLFNEKGGLIGVNTALIALSNDSGSIGIGFAIPSNDAQFVLGRLRQYGRVRAGWTGVSGQSVSEGLSEAVGLERPIGILVTGVDPDSPAAKADIRIGDVVLKVGYWDITNLRIFNRAAGVQPIGSTQSILLWRDGKEVTTALDIGEWPDDRDPGVGVPAAQARFMRPLAADFGLTLVAEAAANRPTFSLAPFQTGVLVTAVTTNSDAADEGIVPGDVIVRVQDNPVATPDEIWFYASAARTLGRSRVLVMVVNASGSKFVALPFRDEPLGCGSDGCVDGVQKPATARFVR